MHPGYSNRVTATSQSVEKGEDDTSQDAEDKSEWHWGERTDRLDTFGFRNSVAISWRIVKQLAI